MTSEEQRGARGPQGDRKREGGVQHDWGEPDVDWFTTRVCGRCGIVHKYDHGSNNGPETFTLGFRTSVTDPGCDDPTAAQPARRKP